MCLAAIAALSMPQNIFMVVRGRIRHDERVQVDARVAKTGLDLLDGRVELNFGIGRAKVPNVLRVHKDDVLLAVQ